MTLQGRRFHQSKGAFTRAIIFQYQGQGALGTRMFTVKSDPELNSVMSNSNVASILSYKQFKLIIFHSFRDVLVCVRSMDTTYYFFFINCK